MEDSKLLIYIVLGAIYFLSKFLKTKKPVPPVEKEADLGPEIEEQRPQRQTGPTFEELLAELTGDKKETPVEHKPSPTFQETTPEVTWPEDSIGEVQPSLDDEIKEIEEVKAPHTIVREKPKYERSKKYMLKQDEDDEVAEDVISLMSDAYGAKRAIVLNEILNRKY